MTAAEGMPQGTSQGTPQGLLAHHLKQLRKLRRQHQCHQKHLRLDHQLFELKRGKPLKP